MKKFFLLSLLLLIFISFKAYSQHIINGDQYFKGKVEGQAATTDTGFVTLKQLEDSLNNMGSGITFGSATQIPFTNSTTNGFSYSSSLKYDATGHLFATSLQLGSNPPSSGIIGLSNNSIVYAERAGGGGFMGVLGTDASNNILIAPEGNTIPPSVIVNAGGRVINFKVEGDNDANLIYGAASIDRVGIGLTNPSEKLEVNGNIKATNFIASDSITSNSVNTQNLTVDDVITFPGIAADEGENKYLIIGNNGVVTSTDIPDISSIISDSLNSYKLVSDSINSDGYITHNALNDSLAHRIIIDSPANGDNINLSYYTSITGGISNVGDSINLDIPDANFRFIVKTTSSGNFSPEYRTISGSEIIDMRTYIISESGTVTLSNSDDLNINETVTTLEEISNGSNIKLTIRSDNHIYEIGEFISGDGVRASLWYNKIL